MIWPAVPLAEALDSALVFVDGDWVESKDQDPDGDVRLIQLADIGDGYYVNKSNRFLTSDAARRLKCTFLQTGDLLIARMPEPLGRACIFPGDSKRTVTVVDVCIIRPDSNTVHTPWLMHCINSPQSRNQIDEYTTGTTRQRISRGNLAKIKVALPPLEEQHRIAAILDQAETLRIQRRAALAQLDSLTQSLFLDMFGDVETNLLNLPKATLGSLIKLKSGNFLPASQMAVGGTFPVYGGNGINGFHDAYMFKEPKIVIGRVGAYCGCVHVTKPCSWVTDNALYLDTVSNSLQSEYLAFALTEARMNQYASQSGQPLISGARLAQIPLLVPPLPLQQTFATRIQAIEALKATHRAALAQLDALFASLQQRAFAGEL